MAPRHRIALPRAALEEEGRMSDAAQRAVQPRMGAAAWGMLVTLSVLWGGSFFFNGVAVRELPPLTIVLARVGIAAAALWMAMWAFGLRMPRVRGLWATFLALGLLNNVLPFGLIVWGQQHIASGLAAILNATTPLFTVLVAHRLTRDERMTTGKLAGVVIGALGVAIMVGPTLPGGLGSALGAQLACLAAALSYALAGVYGRRFRRMGVPPMATATGQVTASTFLLLPVVLLIEQPWALSTPSATAQAALIGLGVVSTAVAYVLYFRILAVAGATNLLLVTFLIPVSAILLGTLLLAETLTVYQAAGMALIGAGLLLVDGRLARSLRGRRYLRTG
jgi:drug/metabolite transporter (DMT)-like permease